MLFEIVKYHNNTHIITSIIPLKGGCILRDGLMLTHIFMRIKHIIKHQYK